MKLRKSKKGVATDEVIKWIIWIAIIFAVGFAVKKIVDKMIG